MRRSAVLGRGGCGMELARRLGASAAQVIAIDASAALVDNVKDVVDVAVRLDVTDEDALAAQEVDKLDVCVVAIGESFESALLATVILKKLGCPRIICRAQTAFHAEIFRRIGADEVIQPEVEAGEILARRLGNPHLEDYIPLAEDYTLLEMHAPAAFHGKTLKDLALRAKYGVNLVAIKRPVETVEGDLVQTGAVTSVPGPDDVIQREDLLVIVGSNKSLAKLPRE
ncbi:MAG: TrkA family potassium uptake protein [Planctomycetes bacterium]|nr:TrkA family potassium uptake protein [Planctomycetota bacterium]